MFSTEEFLILILCLYLGLYVFSKVADIFHPYFQKNRYQFKLYYKISIAIMIIIISFVASIINVNYFFDRCSTRPDNKYETYRLENVNYNICLQNNGSANVEHILMLSRNEQSSDEKIKKGDNLIEYEFDEISDISDIHVYINGVKLNDESSITAGTYTTKLSKAKNKIVIKVSNIDKNIEIKIKYFIKNALERSSDGDLIYYNKFLAYRSGLSYNTQFKGNINFIMPKGSKCIFAGYCKDLYVKTEGNGDNIANIYFENRLPKDFFLYRGRAMTIIKKYDDFNFKGEYTKNFSTIVGVKFLSNSNLDIDKLPQLGESNYSVEELINMNVENNKKYSDFHFVLTFIGEIIINGIILLLLVMIPFIRWYYKKKLNEYWEYMLEEK